MKPGPTRLTEAERQSRRQHQIDLGKATQGYRNLVVLREHGVIPDGPKTPDPTVKFSKRQFDKEIREWRRKLHAFDNVDFKGLKQQMHVKKKKTQDSEHPWSDYHSARPSTFRAPSPSSVSSEGMSSRYTSVSPDHHANAKSGLLMENETLRCKVQELTYKNVLLLERLHQQEMLLRTFMDTDHYDMDLFGPYPRESESQGTWYPEHHSRV
jgi:hypothetical protein